MKVLSRNIPTVFIIFGATGDVMARKVVPALYHLFEKNKLPKMFKIIGFSRQDLSDQKFGEKVFGALTEHSNANLKICGEFCNIFSYHKGDFNNKADYVSLAKKLKEIDETWGVCTNKLFYFAVPPQFYETIFKNLAESQLTKPCSPKEGWSRVLVEKPFGRDLKTAKELDRLLGKLFKEIQIYRIDHYLAKEMLQNILSFRFANNLFEDSFNSNSIEKIEIRLLEKLGVEHRGSFYDSVGALQDVGQNHMLQMLALVTMDNPVNLEAETIRRKRAEILQSLIPPSKEEIKQFTYRAQYEGYRNIEGVAPDSNTETYFKIRAFLSTPKFRGVPIILESGKKMEEQVKEIEITLEHPMPCLCPPEAKEHYKNKITFSIEPREAITIQFWSKKPGLEFEMEKKTLNFTFRETKEGTQYIEEYEKLLLDAIVGDQTLFVSTDEMMAMWKFIDPIIKEWSRSQSDRGSSMKSGKKDAVPMKHYKPHTDRAVNDSSFINTTEASMKNIKKEIGFVGLGKMGSNLAKQLSQKGWKVSGFDSSAKTETAITLAPSLKNLVGKITKPRMIWLMLPAGKITDDVIKELTGYLAKGDIIIDGGNAFYKDSVRRYKKLKQKGIHFMDVGVSGGPKGALEGASLMIGGDKQLFEKLEPLFYDLAIKGGYQFLGSAGAGHFTKMIHNGIEYGMMQAIAEGFDILKKSNYKLDLEKVSDVYNHGSVIESKLVGWLQQAFQIHSQDLKDVSGSVAHTGEGAWTVETAKKLKIKTKVIEEALKFRVQSKNNPNYQGKVLSALREQFGGHSVK